MIFEIILLLIALLSIVLYFSVIKPFLTYRKYVQLLPKLGYKVYVHPFRPFGSHVRQMMVRDRQKYGDVVKSFKDLYPNFDLCVCNVLQQPVLQIVNPDLIKEFYQNNNQYNYVKADIITSAFKMLVKHGILMKQGNEWRQRKKIISSVFTHEFLINLMPEIHKICIRRFDEMEKKFKTGEKKFQVNLNLTFQEIFSQVIVRLFFGSEPTQTLDGKNICVFINEIMFDIVKQLKSPLFNIFGEAVASRNLKKKLKSFKQLARSLIDKRIDQINQEKQNPAQPRDIVEALVLSGQFSYEQHKLTQDDERLTYDDLIGQFCTLFVAGMDTTSNFMTSLVYHLAKQPSAQILQKLRQEIEGVMNEKQGEHLSFKDIKKMNYTDMVQKQGLRMFSPVNGIFFRKAIKDHYLKDIPIPVGMTVVARNRPNFFKEEYFPDPFTFNPERWTEVNHQLHPYAYLPFSSGARTCLGNTLSMMESKIVLAELLHRYKTMKLQKENYRMVIVFIYAPEKTMITLQKE